MIELEILGGFGGSVKAKKTEMKKVTEKKGKEVSSDLVDDGLNSKYLGRHIIRNGSQKQKFMKPPLPCMHFYSENKQFFDPEINVNNSVIMCRSYDSNLDVLQT